MFAFFRMTRPDNVSDVVLAGVVLTALVVMLVPLPPVVLDILLSLNLVVAVTLLMLAIYVPSPVRLAAFPSILLLATLLRLSLNVASTRMILAHGEGSAVVTAFGSLVTGGDLVVGIILFIILTLVQFLVVAKGSERVAEVAARFTLDAMPGKQMSIDADLRGGNIDFEEGARRRSLLQVESQLYGAMDGAMKFVKGDAIAGLVITAINIVGGILIGVWRLEMPTDVAVETFATLTIGDGLVSQVPAMMISVAAGFMTTSVNEGNDSNLGFRLQHQLVSFPRAPAIAGGFLLVLALVPGMPGNLFAPVGLAILGASIYMMKRQEEAQVEEQPAQAEEYVTKAEVKIARMQRAQADKMLPMVTPILIEYSRNLNGMLGNPQGRFVKALIPELRNGLFFELGIRFPNVRLRVNPWLEEPDCYVIYINEIPTTPRRIRQDCILVNESPSRLKAFNVTGESALNPATGVTNAWVAKRYRSVLERACFECWDAEEYIILDLAENLRRNASRFLSVHDVKEIINQLEKAFPALVHEIVPQLISLPQLTEVLRRLVSERISIRDQKTILQSVAAWAPLTSGPPQLASAVRRDLRDYITHRLVGVGQTLSAYLLDDTISETIRSSIVDTADGTFLALPPEISHAISESIRRTVDGKRQRDQVGPVFLTDPVIRPYVQKLLQADCPRVNVVSYDELRPEIIVEPLARVTIDDDHLVEAA